MIFNKSFQSETTSANSFSSLNADWELIGSLKSLSIKTAKEPSPRSVTTVQAIADSGLVGDQHASPQSPRQVLLTGTTAYQRWGLPPGSLRENLLINFSTDQLDLGDLVRVGNNVILWMMFLCEPCSRLERRCPGTLKTIGANRGMLARVLRGGVLRQGDPVALCRSVAPVFSDDWKDRVLHVVRSVPEGFRISYRQLAEMAGVHTSYCRAFSRVLSRLPAGVANRAGSDANMTGSPTWSGAGLFDISAYLTPSHQRK